MDSSKPNAENIERLSRQLTERQCLILYWVCRGLQYVEVGQKIGWGEDLVQKEMTRVYELFGLKGLSQTDKRRLLTSVICPIHLRLHRNPETDCKRSGLIVVEPPPEPDPKTVEEVKKDAAGGLIPLKLLPEPEIVFSADAYGIQQGTYTVLRWKVKNAQSVSLDGVGVASQGYQRVSPPDSATYVLGVTALTGDIILQSITINVFRLGLPRGSRWGRVPSLIATALVILGCLGATIFVISQILPLSLPRVFHTPTLEVAVITSAMPSATLLPTNTPYPPNATYTPYPPNPTYTPYLPQRIPTVAIPTRIPTPMATVSLDTPPGTVLQRGQSWRQNGISLGIQEIRLCPNNSSVTFDFDLINYSDQEIIVTVIPDQFSVKDNSGRIWPLRGFSTYVLCPDPGSPGAQDTRYTDAVTPGDHFFAPGHRGWLISFEGPLTDSKVTSLTITVNGLSRISNARWSIPVGR